MSEKVMAIDADGHILERQSDIRRYLDGKWKNRKTDLFPGDQPWDFTLDYTLGHQYGYRFDLEPQRQLEIWAQAMEEGGMEQAILFPTLSGGVAKLQEKDFAIAVARACNRHFAEAFSTPRLHPLGVLPLRDPAAAAREIEFASRELGLKGFEILTTGLPTALGDPIYDPVYEVAQDLGVALCVHGTRAWGHELGGATLRSFAEMHAYAFPAGMMLQFTSMMLNGVTERFPRLKLGFMEAGGTWLPYYLDRLDEHWEKRGEVECPLLTMKPSALFRQSNIVASIEAEESLLAETLAYLGDGHLVFASDLPHWDSSYPENLAELRDHPGFTADAKRKLLRDNAKAFFGI
jgi:predicted TIM-barrel fold metal-dependent hydrolase